FFCVLLHPTPSSTLFPYTTLFRSLQHGIGVIADQLVEIAHAVGHARAIPHRPRPRQRGLEPGEAWVDPYAGEIRDRGGALCRAPDRKSTRLNSSHLGISYAVFCLK